MTAFTLPKTTTNLSSSTFTFLSISAAVVILQLVIFLVAQMQIPEETTAPQNITKAVTNHDQTWQSYLELIGRQERSSESLANPGFRQKIIANFGTKIAEAIDRQIADSHHPMYRQSEDVGLTRTELNANRLMAIGARGVTSTAPNCQEDCTQQGVIIILNNPTTGQPLHLRMPSEALQLIALGQAEAAGTIRTHQLRPRYNLNSDLNQFFQIQMRLQQAYAYLVSAKGFPDLAAQLRKVEELVNRPDHFVGLDGGVYGN